MRGQGQSNQVIKLFQITPYVNDFQTLNNPGSWEPVGALKKKIKVFLSFLTQVILDDVKLAELSNNSFEWKNVTFYGVKTYSDPSYIFSGSQDPSPQDLRPWDLDAAATHAEYFNLGIGT